MKKKKESPRRGWCKQPLTLEVLKLRVEIVLDNLDALICLETNKNMIHNLTNIYNDLKEAIE
jgi:hypothetical protein